MSNSSIYCPGGSSSQTGVAVIARHSKSNIISCGKIPDIPLLLDDNNGPYVIPIWNSNQGEIPASEYVWDLIQQATIKIHDIWPKSIEFWFVVRSKKHKKYGLIGSVEVAESQCSNFLDKQHAKLKPYLLTTDAHRAFKRGAHLDGVLVAPGQGEDDNNYKVINKHTSNKNNFTSFVTLTPSHSKGIKTTTTSSWLTGVTMASLAGAVLNEEQISFFEKVFSSTLNLGDIPKLIFVFKRDENIGLLFEGKKFTSGDFLNAEELDTGEIVVHEDIGELELCYTQELDQLITQEHPDLKKADFILHRGDNTFLFACPPLNMYTHGYDEKTVEPVVRLYINKIFEFIDNGAKCSKTQKALFNRHKNSWKKKKSEFIEFTVIK